MLRMPSMKRGPVRAALASALALAALAPTAAPAQIASTQAALGPGNGGGRPKTRAKAGLR